MYAFDTRTLKVSYVCVYLIIMISLIEMCVIIIMVIIMYI